MKDPVSKKTVKDKGERQRYVSEEGCSYPVLEWMPTTTISSPIPENKYFNSKLGELWIEQFRVYRDVLVSDI